MQRRKLLLGAASVGLVALGGGAVWLNTPGNGQPLTTAAAIERLNGMLGRSISSSGKWTPFQIFNHIAQSIEFSMSGYPQLKSAAFQSVLGQPVFHVFSKRRAMSHSLSEPIPGAAAIAENGIVDDALGRVVLALRAFDAHTGPLRPHFAYGALSKNEFEVAHAMHLYNHLNEVFVAT